MESRKTYRAYDERFAGVPSCGKGVSNASDFGRVAGLCTRSVTLEILGVVQVADAGILIRCSDGGCLGFSAGAGDTSSSTIAGGRVLVRMMR